MTQQAVPLWVWLDVSSACNLACQLCYTLSMQKREFMSVEMFAAIVDDLRSGPWQLVKFHLNWRGEPSANRHLPEMLAYVDDCGWDVEWHTNGTMITERRAVQVVAATANQRIFISLDGGSAASFEANRGAGMWPRALRGAEALLEARGTESRPEIGVYQLDFGVPLADYDPRFLRVIERVDQHIVTKPVAVDGGHLQIREPVPHGPCFWLGNSLIVDAGGEAHTCLLSSCTHLGSVLDDGVGEVMRRATELRERVVVGGRRTVSRCASCRKREGSTQHALARAEPAGNGLDSS